MAVILNVIGILPRMVPRVHPIACNNRRGISRGHVCFPKQICVCAKLDRQVASIRNSRPMRPAKTRPVGSETEGREEKQPEANESRIQRGSIQPGFNRMHTRTERTLSVLSEKSVKSLSHGAHGKPAE